MILKLVVSAVPAAIFGLLMWDVMTLIEKINQHENLLGEIEEDLIWVQNDIKATKNKLNTEIFVRESKN